MPGPRLSHQSVRFEISLFEPISVVNDQDEMVQTRLEGEMKFFALAFSCLLFFSMPANANDADTFNAMVALANKGDAEAQYHVGMMYNNGIGTQQDRVGRPLGGFKNRLRRTTRWEPISLVVTMTGKAQASWSLTRIKL
jgi:TPR repeat protein